MAARTSATLSCCATAAAAAEGDYAFACDFLARPQAVRTFASGRGLSYVGVGLKLRELTAEELERIQRAKDRAAASDRAAAIAAVTTGRARSRSGRRVLDPLDKSVVVSAFAASARSRPGSASSSGPQSPRVEHVVVRATNSVYAPPLRGNARWAREGAPDGAILSDAVTRPAPRPPAAHSRPSTAPRGPVSHQ